MSRAFWGVLAALALVAALTRVAHERAVLANDPLARCPLGDERTFLEWGHRVAHGEDSQAPYQSPLYPTLTGALERLGADPLRAARGLQALLGLVAAGLAGLMAWEASRDRRAALVAFALCAFARPLVHAEGTFLRESASAAVLGAAALAFARARERGKLEDNVALGLSLGLGCVLRENFAVVALVVLVERLFALRGALEPRKTRFVKLAVFGMALLLPILPFDMKVARLGGGLHLLPNWNQGCVFYLANRRDNPTEAGYMPPPFLKLGSADAEIEGFRAEARKRAGEMTDHGIGAFWLKEGLKEVAADPGRFASRVLWRALSSLAPGESAHARDIEVDAERSWILRLPLIDLGALIALSVAGAVLVLPRASRRHSALLLIAGAWWLSLLGAAFTTRYRVPATPVLAALAALGGRDLARARVARLVPALAAALLILALGVVRAPADHATAWLNRGIAGLEVRDFSSAVVDLERYSAARPQDRAWLAKLAACELAMGRPHAALAALERADPREPNVGMLRDMARGHADRDDTPLPVNR
jgi:hypothetical protein